MLRTIESKDTSMSPKASRPNNQILEEASTWFVAFRSQDIAQNARQEFQDWLKQSPEHIRAYLEIASIYADIPAPENRSTPPELIEKAKASADISAFSLRGGGRLDEAPARGRWLFASRVALAAALLIFAFVGVWLVIDRNTYRTGIGEQRSITLADGSLVELNARSKVRIALGEEQRDVELLEGEALFRVARDHNRPFVVHAGTTSVRAVGTQFDVYRKSTGTMVTVLEGRVAILLNHETPTLAPTATAAPDTAPERESEILLAAGEQMIVTPMRSEKADRPNVAAATAWTQHQLVFDGTPLREVLEEFSRYTTRRLVLDSPELANLKISGQYTSASPDSLVRFLSLQKGVVVTEVNGEIRIRRE